MTQQQMTAKMSAQKEAIESFALLMKLSLDEAAMRWGTGGDRSMGFLFNRWYVKQTGGQ